MQNVTITIDGKTKKLELLKNQKGYDSSCHLIGGSWYMEDGEVEVKPENKNYKILAFRNTIDPNVLYNYNHEVYINNMNGCEYTLNEMFIYCREGVIEVYKVKRLSDNCLITVGDVTEFGKIEKIDMVNQTDCNVRYAEVKPDHQIISFRDVSGISWLVSEEGKYISYKVPYSSYTLDNMLQSLKSKAVEIEAVSRLSDHQVFTVGNGMNYKGDLGGTWDGGKKYCEIKKFTLRDGKIYVNEHQANRNIEDWILYVEPPVMLTTEDGVKIIDELDILYILSTKDFTTIEVSACNVRLDISYVKYFSTPEARNEYILLNKPVLVTFKEILNHHHDCMGKRFTNIEDGIEVFFKLKHELIKPEFPNDHIG